MIIPFESLPYFFVCLLVLGCIYEVCGFLKLLNLNDRLSKVSISYFLSMLELNEVRFYQLVLKYLSLLSWPAAKEGGAGV